MPEKISWSWQGLQLYGHTPTRNGNPAGELSMHSATSVTIYQSMLVALGEDLSCQRSKLTPKIHLQSRRQKASWSWAQIPRKLSAAFLVVQWWIVQLPFELLDLHQLSQLHVSNNILWAGFWLQTSWKFLPRKISCHTNIPAFGRVCYECGELQNIQQKCWTSPNTAGGRQGCYVKGDL